MATHDYLNAQNVLSSTSTIQIKKKQTKKKKKKKKQTNNKT